MDSTPSDRSSVLSRYFAEIRAYPLLTKEEEMSLAQNVKLGSNGDVPSLKARSKSTNLLYEWKKVLQLTSSAPIASMQRGIFSKLPNNPLMTIKNIGLMSFFGMGFDVLAMFLIGVYFGKRQIFQNLESNRPLFRKLLIWGLVIGIPANGIYATLIIPISRVASSWTLSLATVSQGVGAPLLSLAYVTAFALLAGAPIWGKRINVLAPVGQMALSNYLTQSIVCTLIFSPSRSVR